MGSFRLKLRRRSSGGGLLDWGGTQRYAMEILRPKATGLDTNDRIYAAYPGLPYNIGAAVIGGVFPFRYELTANVPSGMEINASTGVINWPNPSTGTYTDITLRVTDTKGTQVTSTWTVVCATTRFKFIAPAGSGGSDSNTGTLASPWATLAKFKLSAGVTGIGVFRAGTYDMTGLVDQGEGIRWGTTAGSPSIFLGYEDETVVFDFGGGQFDFGDGGSSKRVYLDNLTLFGGGNKTLRGFDNANFVCRRFIADTYGPGTNGSNSAFFMTESGAHSSGTWDNYVIQDGISRNMVQGGPDPANCFIKMYSLRHMLIERCHIEAVDDGGNENEAMIANKAGNSECTVRQCTSETCVVPLVGGSQNGGLATGDCDWQVCFNHFKGPNSSLSTVKINEFGTSVSPHFYERNTIEGWVYVDEGQTGEGPFHFDANVVVNNNTGAPAGTHIQHGTPTDLSLDVVTNHLAGFAADGIIDANGLLQGSYRTQYLGLRGHEVPS